MTKSKTTPNRCTTKPTRNQKKNRRNLYAMNRTVILPEVANNIAFLAKDPSYEAIKEQMVRSYLVIKKKKKLLILDIDGTILSDASRGLPLHQLLPRPYLAGFLNEIKPHCDIVLYTGGNYQHAANTHKRFLSRHCSLFFWDQHMNKYDKFIAIFKDYAEAVLVLDNNDIHFRYSDYHHFCQAPTWKGGPGDTFLKKAASLVLNRMASGPQCNSVRTEFHGSRPMEDMHMSDWQERRR